jgi:hypothetical protein
MSSACLGAVTKSRQSSNQVTSEISATSAATIVLDNQMSLRSS